MSSMGSGRLESSFNDMSISSSNSGFSSNAGFGMPTDMDSFPAKSKGIFFPIVILNSLHNLSFLGNGKEYLMRLRASSEAFG